MISDNGPIFKAVPRKSTQSSQVRRLAVLWILSQARLSYDELLTALTEVEVVLNSRPLTYVSAEDLEELLTPSQRCTMSLPEHLRTPEIMVRDVVVEDQPRSHWKLSKY